MGVLAYVLLCGGPPFWGETDEDLFKSILEARLLFLCSFIQSTYLNTDAQQPREISAPTFIPPPPSCLPSSS